MKTILICLMLLVPFTQTFAATKFEPNALWANYFAMKMVKIKTPEDITKQLSFSPQNLIEVKKEIRNKSIMVPNLKYKVFLTQIHIIDEKKKRTVIDFKRFNKSLFINGKSITLNPKKTYSDYLEEVQRILNVKKKVSLLDFILPQAIAQPTIPQPEASQTYLGQFIALFLPAVAYSPYELKGNASSSSVKDTLINMYGRDFETNNSASSYETLNFKCEGKLLNQVFLFDMKRAADVRVAKIYESPRLDRKAGGGYTYIWGPKPEVQGRSSCSATVEDTGQVTEVSGPNLQYCPWVSDNIYSKPEYFGGFSKDAMTCCETEGCYPAVQEKLKELARNYPRNKTAPGFEPIDQAVPASFDGQEITH